MAWSTDLKRGAAAYLDVENAGTYRPDGTAYLPAEVAIIPGRLRDAPDRQIALATYQIPSNQNSGADVLYGLQARIRGARGDEDDAAAIVDAVTDALHGLPYVVWGAVPISQILLHSGTELGPDANDRHEHSLNFYVHAKRTSAHFPDE